MAFADSVRRKAKDFFFSFLVVGLSAVGTLAILINVHDYPQTRQTMAEAAEGKIYARWIPVFYLINEAGSGIKYALTGNPKHFGHFPSETFALARHEEFLAAIVAQAQSGNWCAQLKAGVLYARGYGYARIPDWKEAIRWYTLAHVRVEREAGEVPDFFLRELMVFRDTFSFLVSDEAWRKAHVAAGLYSGIPLDCQKRGPMLAPASPAT